MVRKDLAKFVQENQNDQRISIVTLQTQDRYDSQNTQKSPQSSNRPSQIASLPTTYRTALAIYEDWGLGMDTKAIRSSPIQLKEKIPCHKLIVGTWNVRGCATLDKKKLIDRQLHHLKVTIAGIQETHMTSGSFTSEHYIWILSGGKKAQETRGVGIIIRKNAISRIIKIQRKSNSVLGVHLELNSEPHSYHTDWLIITAHIPQWSTEKLSVSSFLQIASLIRNKCPDSKLLLLGDFNAHIGRDDNRGTKKLVVGYNLFHPTSNHLGSFLLDFCEQHNLVISSTWGRRSCKQGQNPLDWNQLNEILRSSVREHLKFNKNKSKTSRLALAKFMKAKFWKNRSPKILPRYRTSRTPGKNYWTYKKKRMKRNVNTFRTDAQSS
ncbi:hypothetical protein EVAR_40448_1 [Eumeta japonica]|uniref:Endonuclease/exonuclease/phosphatase domain-containing protein n=1 Tax=Eumeta variegata TaxID=151549 RepID=A0A4C1X2A3_EUMVA|nr:hypothetical protein EVAR_40448_1 [Eumeta japonica]